jgi:hypothetical protein
MDLAGLRKEAPLFRRLLAYARKMPWMPKGMWWGKSARASSLKVEASRISRKDAALRVSSTTERITPSSSFGACGLATNTGSPG